MHIALRYTHSHVEGHSTVLGTSLNYCALRILGVDAEHPVLVKARATLHALGMISIPLSLSTLRITFGGVLPGGAAAAPSWSKFWMSVLNVYEWDGNNPIPPELWYDETWELQQRLIQR